MKKKDIITLAFAVAIIALSVFFILRLLSPKATEDYTTSESSEIPTVPQTIDETTYKNLEELSDYGQASLSNIGKSNLFADF